MCWCWPFTNPKPQKRKSSSAAERKRREKQAQDALHGNGIPVAAEVQEKRRSRESDHRRRSKEKVTTRDPRREKAQQQQYQYQYQYQYPAQYQYQQSPRYDQRYYREYQQRAAYRPNLNLEVPNMWHRTVDVQSSNSSTEMLLNPRPQRSQGQHRQRHPKRTSSSTLRGRGAKRDPPRHSKSKKSLKQSNSRQASGWSWFAASPPKTPSRRNYTTYEASPRSNRSPRSNHYQQIPEPSSSTSHQRSPRHHRSRQHQPSSSNRSRTPNPNTAARRTPDRRFAVLAATNAALEDVRREAFSQPSPPPRRERQQRYQGVTIPTSSIPFNWDCVSSSQTSAGTTTVAGPSLRQRRSRRH